MKKAYLNFPRRGISYAPRITSRNFRIMSGRNAAYKEDGEKTPEEERAALLVDIKKQFNSELETRGYVKKDDMETELQKRMKQFENLELDALRTYKLDKEATDKKIADAEKALEDQGLELRKLREMQHQAVPTRKSIASQIRAFVEKNKEAFDAFVSRKTNSFGSEKGDSVIALETRAAVTMGVATSTGGSAFVPQVEILPGLVDLARNQPFLENYANSSATNSSRIVWTEKYNPQGNAAATAEGGVKPLISFEIRTLESYAKKITDKIKISTEMIDDIDFIAGEIESELHYKVDIAVDTSLLSGAGDGTVGATDLKGLVSQVGAYVLTNVATTTPNDFDAIRAGAAQVISLNFNPDTVFINTIDSANMDLVKDAQGRPLAMQYKDANGKIYRLNVVETNQMPIGYVLIGDMSRYKIRNYRPFSISYGWVNDDFEKNLFTVLGERRLHAFIAANDAGAFVYDTFANIKTAITAA